MQNVGPWCWMEKGALNRITEIFGECGQEASARSIYLALCQIASDRQSERFQVPVGTIAAKAGLSTRSALRILTGFEAAGIALIEKQFQAGLKQPSVYTLLPIRPTDTSIGNKVTSMCHERKQLSVSHKERIEESPKEKEEEVKPADEPPPTTKEQTSESFIEELSKSPAYQGIDVQREFHKMRAWCSVNRKMPTKRRFVSWLNRIERPITTPEAPSQAAPVNDRSMDRPAKVIAENLDIKSWRSAL